MAQDKPAKLRDCYECRVEVKVSHTHRNWRLYPYCGEDVSPTGQRAQCPGTTCSNSGTFSTHSAIFSGQRGSKAHPAGTARNPGTVPSIVRSGCLRSVCRAGSACSNPCV